MDVDLEMMVEFVDMFEELMGIIEYKCDFSKAWETDTEYLTIGDMWERAETLLKEAKGIT